MPLGAEMYISSSDGNEVVGPFTAADNKPHGQLWTPVLPGDDILLEVLIPRGERLALGHQIELTSINVGYRGFFEGSDARSGSCNVDVVCSEGDDWWDEIPCVAVISTGGSTFCTGFMVNNTSQDRTPFFMTANHCGVSGSSAPSLVTYWNYQNSWCRPPGSGDSGGAGDGSLNQFNTGSTYLASGSSSDYTLVVLDDQPNDAWEVSYCGWDATGDDATQAIAIHQPATDEKRISFEYQPTTTTSYLGEAIPGDGTHVRVEDWDLGTTEPGSSGSPLFNQDHRVIGQLHGGYASCSSQTSDWYGKFSVSWSGLVAHLDAAGTGQLTLATLPGTGMTVFPNEDVTHVCTSPCNDPDPADVVYEIANNSPDTISWSAEVVGGAEFILLDDGSSTGGFLGSGDTTSIVASVSGETLPDGVHEDLIVFTDFTHDRTETRRHILEIGVTGFTTTPASDFVAGGPVGGPFPTTQVYTIASTNPTPTTVQVMPTMPWITVNGNDGAIMLPLDGTGDTATVEIGFGNAAGDLPPGVVEGDVLFDNLKGDNGDTSRHITLDVGRFTYVATDVPVPINDNQSSTSTIIVGDAYCMGDVDVELEITHTYIGDLTVDLTSPEGTTVRLWDRSGGGDDDISAFFNDDGGDLPDGPGALEDFVGEIVTGTWTMVVHDHAYADTGSLDHWALKIASSGADCPPVAHDVQVSTDENVPVNITLDGVSSSGGELEYILTALPDHGGLVDPSAGAITSVPYTLVLGGDVVRYEPDAGYNGSDNFLYRVDDGQQSAEALVMISVGVLPYPDDCNDASVVTNGDWEYQTNDATTDGPQHDECEFDGQTYNDVWFVYHACNDGTLTASTCNQADYDTDMVIYQGWDCEDPALLACADDTDGCAGYTTAITVSVLAGSDYLVRVGGWNDGDQGTGTLTIDGPLEDCQQECPADVNGDGVAGVNDLLAIIGAWGETGGPEDVNGDGTVDVSDLLSVISAWGPC